MGFTALAAAALLALPAAAQALPEDRTYEMVSPPDKNDGDVGAGLFGGQAYAGTAGDRIVYMSLGGWDAPTNSITGVYAAERGEEFWTSKSTLLPVLPYPSIGGAAITGISPDASRVLSGTNRNPDTGEPAQNGDNGMIFLLNPTTGERELVLPDLDVNGDPVSGFPLEFTGNSDFSRLFMQANAPLTEDAVGLPGSGGAIYLFEEGEHTLQSVLPNGDAYKVQLPTPGSSGLVPNVTSEDADVLFFQVTSGVGDPDPRGVYRRDFSGATPQTVRINEPETEDDPGGGPTGSFGGASSDGTIAYFTSNQRLVDEDENSLTDLYQYDHSKPAGQRLTLISEDGEPADDDAAVTRVHTVSEDGSTVVFSSPSQLVEGEPIDAGRKLYVARDGEIEFVGITGPNTNQGDVSAEGVALAADGSQMALVTSAALTAHDNGGFDQVYVRDNDTGEVECASCRAGAANTAPAAFRTTGALNMFGAGWTGAIRNLSSEGHVFFETLESLLPQDTNGKKDVYIWQDGELDLISTGRSTDHSQFASATPDGKDVFFVTREKLSGWDFDGRLDLYTARVGGGLPEPSEPVEECTGDDCQGPPPLPPPYPGAGSGHYDGPGNPQADPVDCTPAERKANRLANKAQQASKKAKRLKKQARKASGKKAKRLNKRAKKAQRQAKAKRKQARQARSQLALCREEAEL